MKYYWQNSVSAGWVKVPRFYTQDGLPLSPDDVVELLNERGLIGELLTTAEAEIKRQARQIDALLEWDALLRQQELAAIIGAAKLILQPGESSYLCTLCREYHVYPEPCPNQRQGEQG